MIAAYVRADNAKATAGAICFFAIKTVAKSKSQPSLKPWIIKVPYIKIKIIFQIGQSVTMWTCGGHEAASSSRGGLK